MRGKVVKIIYPLVGRQKGDLEKMDKVHKKGEKEVKSWVRAVIVIYLLKRAEKQRVEIKRQKGREALGIKDFRLFWLYI